MPWVALVSVLLLFHGFNHGGENVPSSGVQALLGGCVLACGVWGFCGLVVVTGRFLPPRIARIWRPWKTVAYLSAVGALSGPLHLPTTLLGWTACLPLPPIRLLAAQSTAIVIVVLLWLGCQVVGDVIGDLIGGATFGKRLLADRLRQAARLASLFFGPPVVAVWLGAVFVSIMQPIGDATTLPAYLTVVALLAALIAVVGVRLIRWMLPLHACETTAQAVFQAVPEASRAFGGVLVWKTNRRVAFVGLLGFVRCSRYLLVSDRAVDELSTRQLSLLVRHEWAHVQLGHAWLRLVPVVVLLPVLAGIQSLGEHGLVAWPTEVGLSLVGVILAGVAFCLFARLAELEADWLACVRADIGPGAGGRVESAVDEYVSSLRSLAGPNPRGSLQYPAVARRAQWLRSDNAASHRTSANRAVRFRQMLPFILPGPIARVLHRRAETAGSGRKNRQSSPRH